MDVLTGDERLAMPAKRTDSVITADALTKRFGDQPCRRGLEPHRPVGQGDRIPRSQRSGEDDDPAHLAGHRRAHVGNGNHPRLEDGVASHAGPAKREMSRSRVSPGSGNAAWWSVCKSSGCADAGSSVSFRRAQQRRGRVGEDRAAGRLRCRCPMLGQASFFWNSSQARPRMAATKIAKIPPEAHRLKKS
jgi:hypothetical protein